MKVIYKYQLQLCVIQSIQIPEEAKILCVQMQGGVICLWAEVNDL